MKIYNELEYLGFFEWLSETHNLKDTDMTPECLDELPLNDIHRTVCNSMAFRWFREKYRLDGKPEYFLNNWYCFIINDMKGEDTSRRLFTEIPSYEKAELECLKKLIEIVTTKSKMTLRENFSKYCDNVYQNKEVNAEFCEEIADEFAIGFADWCDENYNTLKPYDVGNILQKYKKEKGL